MSCDVEPIVYGKEIPVEIGGVRMKQYTTVLHALRAAGIWENPIGQRGDFGTSGSGKRLRLAVELHAKILTIQG